MYLCHTVVIRNGRSLGLFKSEIYEVFPGRHMSGRGVLIDVTWEVRMHDLQHRRLDDLYNCEFSGLAGEAGRLQGATVD